MAIKLKKVERWLSGNKHSKLLKLLSNEDLSGLPQAFLARILEVVSTADLAPKNLRALTNRLLEVTPAGVALRIALHQVPVIIEKISGYLALDAKELTVMAQLAAQLDGEPRKAVIDELNSSFETLSKHDPIEGERLLDELWTRYPGIAQHLGESVTEERVEAWLDRVCHTVALPEQIDIALDSDYVHLFNLRRVRRLLERIVLVATEALLDVLWPLVEPRYLFRPVMLACLPANPELYKAALRRAQGEFNLDQLVAFRIQTTTTGPLASLNAEAITEAAAGASDRERESAIRELEKWGQHDIAKRIAPDDDDLTKRFNRAVDRFLGRRVFQYWSESDREGNVRGVPLQQLERFVEASPEYPVLRLYRGFCLAHQDATGPAVGAREELTWSLDRVDRGRDWADCNLRWLQDERAFTQRGFLVGGRLAKEAVTEQIRLDEERLSALESNAKLTAQDVQQLLEIGRAYFPAFGYDREHRLSLVFGRCMKLGESGLWFSETGVILSEIANRRLRPIALQTLVPVLANDLGHKLLPILKTRLHKARARLSGL